MAVRKVSNAALHGKMNPKMGIVNELRSKKKKELPPKRCAASVKSLLRLHDKQAVLHDRADIQIVL